MKLQIIIMKIKSDSGVICFRRIFETCVFRGCHFLERTFSDMSGRSEDHIGCLSIPSTYSSLIPSRIITPCGRGKLYVTIFEADERFSIRDCERLGFTMWGNGFVSFGLSNLIIASALNAKYSGIFPYNSWIVTPMTNFNTRRGKRDMNMIFMARRTTENGLEFGINVRGYHFYPCDRIVLLHRR